jgi:hypothetical protein
MMGQTETVTIENIRALNADRPFRLARLGARPLPYRLLPPPKKIEIVDREPEDTAIDVTECRNQVVFVLENSVEHGGAHVFVGPHDLRLKTANIQRVVAEHFKISVQDIVSPRRTANIIRPRQIAMYLTKTLTMRSLPEIGRRFGGRDHTTILWAVQKIGKQVKADPETAALIETLTIKLKGRAS